MRRQLPIIAALLLALSGGSAMAQTQTVPPKAASDAGGWANSPKAPKTAGDLPEMLLATDPEAVQRVIQEAGYLAKMTKLKNGDPSIEGKVGSTTYYVDFLDCTNGKDCLAVKFYAGYAKPATYEQVNAFNLGYRYARAYLTDEMHPRLVMEVLMRDGGLPRKEFERYLKFWHILVPKFEAALTS